MESIMRQTMEATSPLASTFAPASPRRHDQIMAMDRERNVLYETTGSLVEAAEVVASAPHRDAATPADEANKQALLMAISTALRVARECCRLCKVCAVASGDWYTDEVGRDNGHAKQISTSDSTMSRDTIRHWKHGRSSSTASALGRTKFGWETTDDEDEEELINTLDEDDYTLHAGQMVSRPKVSPLRCQYSGTINPAIATAVFELFAYHSSLDRKRNFSCSNNPRRSARCLAATVE
jgi:hypothetical protein